VGPFRTFVLCLGLIAGIGIAAALGATFGDLGIPQPLREGLVSVLPWLFVVALVCIWGGFSGHDGRKK
jgi:hypothetical protein